MRWDLWRRRKEGWERLFSVDLDAKYDAPDFKGVRFFSSADMVRIEHALRQPLGPRLRAVSQESFRIVRVQLKNGSFRLHLRPPMTMIFDLARDPSYVAEGDGARFVWAISPAWLESYAEFYQGDSPADHVPVSLAEIPSDRFHLLRVAIDHYLETGKPLP